MADHLAEEGYLSAGYEYVTLDDCWQAESRDQHGRLLADPKRFPNGIKALVDYVRLFNIHLRPLHHNKDVPEWCILKHPHWLYVARQHI